MLSGTEYSGQWHKNRFHGEGTRRFKNGNVYNGNYVDGKRHGQGKCYFANGGEFLCVCYLFSLSLFDIDHVPYNITTLLLI